MNSFEELYIALRNKENRVYTDAEVINLPDISLNNPHFSEWKLRKNSVRCFANYLGKKGTTLNILEVGCGNGWFAANLAKRNPDWTIVAIDINKHELDQGKRVFEQLKNLSFQLHDLDSSSIDQKFDIIYLAASVQYFPSLSGTIHTLRNSLTSNGEIHILDTNFYSGHEKSKAENRTKQYYSKLGFDEASQYYQHHTLEELKNLGGNILYNPDSFLNKIFRRNNPFYWVRFFK